jgi:O-antigen ligase
MSTLPDRIESGENNWNPINIRLAILENSLELIQDHWLLGVGPGNMREVLDTYYTKNNFSFGMLNNLDPHNQFLHTFINLGIVGVIVLLLLVISLAFYSVKNRDPLLATLLMIFILFSISASTLSVNKGIMFFSFFFIYLTYLRPNNVTVFKDK